MFKRSTTNKINMALIVALLIAIGVIIYFVFFAGNGDRNAVMYDTTAETPKSELESDYIVPAFKEITFTANTTTQKINLYNPNANDCLFTYDLYVDDEETPIYKSGFVEPGMGISEIEITRNISKGSHNFKIKVVAYDNEDKTSIGRATLETELNVK